MKQIARVVIENFQSHARSTFDFGRGLNVIIGPSDNGKSAVLRAIRWALYNEPRGNEFVRFGARECRVTVTMSDGAEILRELILAKSGGVSRNRYVVKLPGGEPQVFEGFGTELPTDVSRAHGMPQVLLDTDKRVVLSFGSQLEGPFMMTETGSLRARAIGRLLGVHVVDAAMRNTQRDLRTVRQESVRLEQRLQQFDADLAHYADIPEQEARLEEAERLLAQAAAAGQRLKQLEAVQAELARTDREEIAAFAQLSRLEGLAEAELGLARAAGLHVQGSRLERLATELQRVELDSLTCRSRVDALTALPVAEQQAREAAERQLRLTALARIDDELKRREGELAQVGRVLSRLEGVPEAAGGTQAAAEKLQRLERLLEKQAQLADADQRLVKGSEFLRQAETDLKQALAEYEGVLKRLGKCPTCMQPVEPAAVRRIIAELSGSGGIGHTH